MNFGRDQRVRRDFSAASSLTSTTVMKVLQAKVSTVLLNEEKSRKLCFSHIDFDTVISNRNELSVKNLVKQFPSSKSQKIPDLLKFCE